MNGNENSEWCWQFGWLQALTHGRSAIFRIFSGRSSCPKWKARQSGRQTDRPRRGDGESGRQRAGRRVFTRFRLFHSNDIVLSVACWMKRKTETKIKNAKPQTKCCGNFAVGFVQCQWQQIINNFFWGNLCNLVYRVFRLCKLNFLS